MIKILSHHGIVCDLRHTFDTRQHCAIFTLNDQKILLKHNEPIFLENGDDAVIVGYEKKGIFYASAYYNRTQKIIREAAGIGLLLFTIPFFIAGLATLIFGIGLAFLGVASYIAYFALLNIKSNKMIKDLILNMDQSI